MSKKSSRPKPVESQKKISVSSQHQSDAEKYFITPGLHQSVLEFDAHYKASSGEPVMIIGDTGVGKSLFLKFYENLFKSDFGDDKPIIWANCAHFAAKHSDVNIARTELFGLNRMAIHGAGSLKEAASDAELSATADNDVINKLKDTKTIVHGLVERASGGLLILEEIGELQEEVQAMLLTFIETGEYKRVGEGSVRKAQCTIVGATNHLEGLREDFKYRFFPFRILSLCERRIDVLYYLFHKYPDVSARLTEKELFLLLGHNWPGNFREIERVCKLFKMMFYLYDKRGVSLSINYSMVGSRLYEELLSLSRMDNCYSYLIKTCVKEEHLDKVLSDYNLSFKDKINPYHREVPGFVDRKDYVNSKAPVVRKNISANYMGFHYLYLSKYLERINRGYILFCSMFALGYASRDSLFDLKIDIGGMPNTASDCPFFCSIYVAYRTFIVGVELSFWGWSANAMEDVNKLFITKYFDQHCMDPEFVKSKNYEFIKNYVTDLRGWTDTYLGGGGRVKRPATNAEIYDTLKSVNFSRAEASRSLGITARQINNRIPGVEEELGVKIPSGKRGRPKKIQPL